MNLNRCKTCGRPIPEGEDLCEECKEEEEQEDLAGTWVFQESGMPVWY